MNYLQSALNALFQKRAVHEYLRWFVLGTLSLLALIPMWDASQVVFYFIGVVSLIALFSHVARRVFFPYVDVERYAAKALEDPIAASLIFMSITLLLCVMLFSVSSLTGFNG